MDEQTILSKYPIDVDALVKGDEISVERVEVIVGVRYTDRRYALAACQLASWIEGEKLDRGEYVTVATVKGAIRVLTDAEAADYLTRRFAAHEAGLRTSARRKAGVDRSALTEDGRAKHDRELVTMGMKLRRLRGREVTLKPAARATPSALGRGTEPAAAAVGTDDGADADQADG